MLTLSIPVKSYILVCQGKFYKGKNHRHFSFEPNIHKLN